MRIECLRCQKRFGWRPPESMPVAVQTPRPRFPRHSRKETDLDFEARMGVYFRALHAWCLCEARAHHIAFTRMGMGSLLRSNRTWLHDPDLPSPVLCHDCLLNLMSFVHRKRPTMGLNSWTPRSEHQREALVSLWLVKAITSAAKEVSRR